MSFHAAQRRHGGDENFGDQGSALGVFCRNAPVFDALRQTAANASYKTDKIFHF